MSDTLREFCRTVEGAECLALVAQGYSYQGELVKPVSVLYLKFAAGRWARFGIDGGHFHWRETASLKPIPGDRSGNTYPLADLATSYPVVGRRIAAVTFACGTSDRTTLTLAFDEGGTLAVVNHDDHTQLEYLAPAV